MSKKVVIGICAVLAFFLGAIWLDNCPNMGTLVAFLELAVGVAAGFFFSKEMAKKDTEEYVSAIQRLTDANLKASKEIELLKKDAQKEVSVKKKSTKAKAE